MKKSLTLFIISLISIALLVACGNTNKSAGNSGDLAPQFDLRDLEGNQVALEELAGEKVYVKYWASWCSICLAGLDELNTLAAQDNDFKVITIVSPDYKGEKSTDKFIKWYKKLSADNLTVLLDENGIWSKQFHVLAYPSSYYIGSDGMLVKTAVGHNSNEMILNEMEKIN